MIPNLTLSHFETSLLFAALASVVLGVAGRRTDRERVRHAVTCFFCFMAALFGLAWLMKLAHG
jgi:hypothetical protein